MAKKIINQLNFSILYIKKLSDYFLQGKTLKHMNQKKQPNMRSAKKRMIQKKQGKVYYSANKNRQRQERNQNNRRVDLRSQKKQRRHEDLAPRQMTRNYQAYEPYQPYFQDQLMYNEEAQYEEPRNQKIPSDRVPLFVDEFKDNKSIIGCQKMKQSSIKPKSPYEIFNNKGKQKQKSKHHSNLKRQQIKEDQSKTSKNVSKVDKNQSLDYRFELKCIDKKCDNYYEQQARSIGGYTINSRNIPLYSNKDKQIVHNHRRHPRNTQLEYPQVQIPHLYMDLEDSDNWTDVSNISQKGQRNPSKSRTQRTTNYKGLKKFQKEPFAPFFIRKIDNQQQILRKCKHQQKSIQKLEYQLLQEQRQRNQKLNKKQGKKGGKKQLKRQNRIQQPDPYSQKYRNDFPQTNQDPYFHKKQPSSGDKRSIRLQQRNIIQLQKPAIPPHNNRYCFQCKAHYQDYYDHIRGLRHQSAIRDSSGQIKCIEQQEFFYKKTKNNEEYNRYIKRLQLLEKFLKEGRKKIERFYRKTNPEFYKNIQWYFGKLDKMNEAEIKSWVDQYKVTERVRNWDKIRYNLHKNQFLL